MRIRIDFSYDGSKFCGFQRQNDVRSVQKSVEDALSEIYKIDIVIKGAGRTDAGVHANNQVAHFDAPRKIDGLKSKLNELLLPDICIKKVKLVNDDFHARHDAKKKEYVYKINLQKFKTSLNDYCYQPRFKLDISAMKEAAKVFIGTHDFHNFVAGEREDYTTTIRSITFVKVFGKLEIHFVGTGFYRYMVRNLVGALIEAGKLKISSATIKEMLDNPNVPKQLPTAPSSGLYLNKIWY